MFRNRQNGLLEASGEWKKKEKNSILDPNIIALLIFIYVILSLLKEKVLDFW